MRPLEYIEARKKNAVVGELIGAVAIERNPSTYFACSTA
jgi:hypothetical protein